MPKEKDPGKDPGKSPGKNPGKDPGKDPGENDQSRDLVTQGAGDPSSQVMAKAEQIEREIAAFTTLEHHMEGKNQLDAMRLYAKKKKVERALIQRLAASNLKLVYRMGKLLAEILKPGRKAAGSDVITLDDLNISRTSSHRYQEISDIPEDVFEGRIKKMITEDDDLTESEFYRFAKNLKKIVNESPPSDDDDGTSRMEDEQKVRDDFLALSLEMIQEIRAKKVPGVEALNDEQLSLVARAIIEVVTIEDGPIKKQVEKFVGENALDENNYWTGLRVGIRQLSAVHLSLQQNTTPASPKSLLYFNQNIAQMIGLLKSWNPDKMDVCPDCEGSKEILGEGKKKLPCPTCLNGKVGWFKTLKS